MSDWKHEIDLGEAFDPGDFIEYSEQAFLVHRDRVVKILKASAWLRDSQYSWTLSDYVIDMEQSRDIQEFDTVMDGVHDIADADRCRVRSGS